MWRTRRPNEDTPEPSLSPLSPRQRQYMSDPEPSWNRDTPEQLRTRLVVLAEERKRLAAQIEEERAALAASVQRKSIFWKILGPVIGLALAGIGVWVWGAIRNEAINQLTIGSAKVEDVAEVKSDLATVNRRIDAVEDYARGTYQAIVENKSKTEVIENVKAARRKRGAQ